MDKSLRAHTAQLKNGLKNWSKEEAKHFYEYHVQRVRDFQHERLIHLLVTLFFGILFLFSLAILFVAQSFGLMTVSFLGLALVIVLFLTELFYIRYYFVLENGVQRLYPLTEQLAKLAGVLPLD